MKKAGIINGAGKKLNLFKAGRKKLEAEIKKDSSNVELRFLRLMTQENAPGILGYKNELQTDREYIRKGILINCYRLFSMPLRTIPSETVEY